MAEMILHCLALPPTWSSYLVTQAQMKQTSLIPHLASLAGLLKMTITITSTVVITLPSYTSSLPSTACQSLTLRVDVSSLKP